MNLVRQLSRNPLSKKIINLLISFLRQDISKINTECTKFILKLLRKYIERENLHNPNFQPIYLWEEVTLTDQTKMQKIQHDYYKMGLTPILYNIMLTTTEQIIFTECVLVSLAYLYGGNNVIQKDFFNLFVAIIDI